MNRKCFIFFISLICILCFVSGCSSRTSADKYVAYINHVISILENTKIGASNKGTEIKNYVDSNKTDIEKTLADLKAMSLQETEKVVDKVRTKVNIVLDTIKLASQDAPQMAEDKNLIQALTTLKVIGE